MARDKIPTSRVGRTAKIGGLAAGQAIRQAGTRAANVARTKDGRNAALELYHEVSATNPDFKKVYDSMTAFRGDQYLWWQVAEYSNDTFMIRNRAKV